MGGKEQKGALKRKQRGAWEHGPKSLPCNHLPNSASSEISLYCITTWAMRDSNPQHPRCKRGALTN